MWRVCVWTLWMQFLNALRILLYEGALAWTMKYANLSLNIIISVKYIDQSNDDPILIANCNHNNNNYESQNNLIESLLKSNFFLFL